MKAIEIFPPLVHYVLCVGLLGWWSGEPIWAHLKLLPSKNIDSFALSHSGIRMLVPLLKPSQGTSVSHTNPRLLLFYARRRFLSSPLLLPNSIHTVHSICIEHIIAISNIAFYLRMKWLIEQFSVMKDCSPCSINANLKENAAFPGRKLDKANWIEKRN